MNEIFKISLYTNTTYRILSQPKIDFSYRIGNTYVASHSFPDTDLNNIYLQGRDVALYSGHLKVLEELCRRQHWRFVICI